MKRALRAALLAIFFVISCVVLAQTSHNTPAITSPDGHFVAFVQKGKITVLMEENRLFTWRVIDPGFNPNGLPVTKLYGIKATPARFSKRVNGVLQKKTAVLLSFGLQDGEKLTYYIDDGYDCVCVKAFRPELLPGGDPQLANTESVIR